jgi:hypothetical protein
MDRMEQANCQEQSEKQYELGERLLYLRTPHFTGKDVEDLQNALGALGFVCGGTTGEFGGYTEGALRRFQLNMGLEPDGIAGMLTYKTLDRLHKAWRDKPALEDGGYMGFARAADVLERHAVCLFGTDEFNRRVASYMSNLALATNPRSRVVSADTLLVAPDASMLLAHLVSPDDETDRVPRVTLGDTGTLPIRLKAAMDAAQGQGGDTAPDRIAIEVPAPEEGATEEDCDRLAHHRAIALIDALCVAFS